jgi:hypothetical protein
MIEGVRERAIAAGGISRERFYAGIRALHRSAGADGVSAIRSSRVLAASRHKSSR